MQSRILILLIIAIIGGGAIWYTLVSRDNTPKPSATVADTSARSTANTTNAAPPPAGPRHLTAEVKQQIRDRIPQTRKISIKAVPDDPEVADYANEFAKFFTDSGYTVDGPSFTVTAGSRGLPRGLQINTFDSTPSEPVQITVGIK